MAFKFEGSSNKRAPDGSPAPDGGVLCKTYVPGAPGKAGDKAKPEASP